MIMLKVILLIVLPLLIQFADGSADLGLNIGSQAAGKLATHCIHYALRQPRILKLDLQSSVNPWFEKIADVKSRTKLSLSNFTIDFNNDMVELTLHDVIFKSKSKVNILPLPFFLGEDTAHIYAEIPRASLKLDVRDFDVKLHDCRLETTALDVSLDRAFLLNLFLRPLHSLLPSSMVEESLCSSIADSLSVFENRFALEIGLNQLVPDKFREYLAWPNSTMFAQLASAEAKDNHLSLRIAVDWENNAGLLGSTTEETITVIEPTTTSTQPPAPSVPFVGSGEVISDEVTNTWNNIPTTDAVEQANSNTFSELTLRDEPLTDNGNILAVGTEHVTMWVEDQLINDVFQEFRWDFEWMTEEIPVESPKLPIATREFLSTLCTNCYFQLRVSANGAPHVAAVNESVVLEKSDRIFLKVVNPLSPKIESGIFRTQVDLLDTQIKMEKGAFPSSWNFFVQDLVKEMIMDVIWPGLKKKIEDMSYSDGVEIPSTCGMEPQTAELHFDGDRFGASTALQLDDVSLGTCLQQLKSKLPDPASLFVIKESR